MATSAYSGVNQSQNIGGFESVDYVGEVQRAIQGKIDINKEKTNQVIKQFANVDLVRDEDKAKFVGKLKGIVDKMNGSEGLDFRDSSLPSALDAELQTAFDSETMKQIGNTRAYRKFSMEMEKKKAEGKGKYNQVNEWFARRQSGLDDYLSGKTNDLGGLNYTDYVDVNGTLQKELQTWIKEVGLQSNVQTDAQGRPDVMTILKSKSVDAQRIRTYLQNRLDNSPELQQQLMMNGAYDYQTVSDESLQKVYKKDLTDRIQKGKDLILQYQGEMAGLKKDSPEYQEYEEAIKQIEAGNENFNQLKDIPINRSQFEYKLASERLVDGLAVSNQKYEVTDIKFSDMFSKVREREFNKYIKSETLELAKINAQQNIRRTDLLEAKTMAALSGAGTLGKEPTQTTRELGDEEKLSKGEYELRVENKDNITQQAIETITRMEGVNEEEAKKILHGMVKNGGNIQFGAGGTNAALNSMVQTLRDYHIQNKQIGDENLKGYMNEDLKEYFNNLVTSSSISDSTLSNLEMFQPTLSGLVKKAKTGKTSYEDLTQKEKALLAAETLKVHTEIQGQESGMVKEDGVYLMRQSLYNQYPQWAEELQEQGKKTENKHFHESMLSAAGNVITGEFDNITSTIGNGFRRLFGNSLTADRKEKESEASQRGYIEAFQNNLRGANRELFRIFRTDANQNQLSQNQVGGKKITEYLNNRTRGINERLRSIAESDPQFNLKHRFEYTFSPDKKSAVYEELRNIASSKGFAIPNNSPVTIYKDYKSGTVSARYNRTNSKGETKVINFDFPEQDSKQLSRIIQDERDQAYATAENPNSPIYKVKIDYKAPLNNVEMNELATNLNQYNPTIYSGGYFKSGSSGLNTVENYMKIFENSVDNPLMVEEYRNILNKEYSTGLVRDFMNGVQISISEKGGISNKPLFITNINKDLSGLTEETFHGLIPYAMDQYYRTEGVRLIGENNKITE